MKMRDNIWEDEHETFHFDNPSWKLCREEDDFLSEEAEVIDKVGNRTFQIVVIYDIVDDKRRYHMSKTLLGFGERVQRSAFECHLTQRKYEQMIAEILPLIDEEEDLLRVYKLTGNTQTQVWGKIPETFDEDLIII